MTAFKLRSQKVVHDCATSFVSEGYTIVTKFESVSLMFYKLHHRSNGNTIVIKAYPGQNWMTMSKNGMHAFGRKILLKNG